MGKQLLVASLISLAILAVYYTSSEAKVDAFEEWKGQYGINWAPEEEAYRRLIFEKNMILISKHNADHTQTYKMGVNQFTIFTSEEFATRFLTPMTMLGAPQYDNDYEVIGAVDWTTQGKVSPVKNQGSCGSCWAFSASGVTESGLLFKGQTVSLSEQQLVDCSRKQGNQGCNGGWPHSALTYAAIGGWATTTEYPSAYIAKDQACKKDGGSIKVSGQKSFQGCSGLTSGINSSPVSVTVDATNWSPYRSGVFTNCGSSINHAVLLVGVDASGAWKIKNSWGTGWGESGFIRLATGNTCGLCAYPGVTAAF
jgi:C1A family cysteine protease